MSVFILTKVSGLRKLKEQHESGASSCSSWSLICWILYKCMKNPVSQQTKQNISEIE